MTLATSALHVLNGILFYRLMNPSGTQHIRKFVAADCRGKIQLWRG